MEGESSSRYSVFQEAGTACTEAERSEKAQLAWGTKTLSHRDGARKTGLIVTGDVEQGQEGKGL